MRNLAIIPARGGSKRIPRKNIKLFMGKPIMAYSIETALQSGLFDEVMVSTDDEEIANIALKYGAKIPFMRGEKTANDYAVLADVLKEVLDNYLLQNIHFDNMCCILATCPLLNEELLRRGFYKLLSTEDISTVFPIVPFSYPVMRCLQKDVDDVVSMKWPEYSNVRSQDIETLYHDSGTFYWHKIDLWRAGKIKRSSIVLDEMFVQDIDTETDWKLAEMKYSILHDL